MEKLTMPNKLRYGGVPSEEAEVIIRLDKQDGFAHISSSWAEWSRKLERLHGQPTQSQGRGGFVTVATWMIPVALVSLRRRKRTLTPEQAKSTTNRLRNARPSVRSSGSTGTLAKISPEPVSDILPTPSGTRASKNGRHRS